MLLRSLTQWLLAGCLSATALNFAISPKDAVRLEQPATHTTPGPPSLSKAVTSVTPSIKDAAQVAPVDLSAPVKQGAEAAAKTGTLEYRLQPEDALNIRVFEEPDLETKVRVSGSGEIDFPLLGRVRVAGLSVMEVQDKLEKLLGEDYLVNPQIEVFIMSYHARNVFVTGAVAKPGQYPLALGKSTTVMEAVTMAGGFTKEAAVNGTRIIRIENGKEKTIYVKANEIIKKGDKTKDVEVAPNDVVFVPESFF